MFDHKKGIFLIFHIFSAENKDKNILFLLDWANPLPRISVELVY